MIVTNPFYSKPLIAFKSVTMLMEMGVCFYGNSYEALPSFSLRGVGLSEPEASGPEARSY